jgi:hypothetical protein
MLAPMPESPLTEQLLKEREALIESIEAQRGRLERFEGIVETLNERLEHDDYLLGELDGLLGTAAQLRLETLDPRLHGKRLEEVAIAVLREDLGAGVEVHYRDWFELLRARGHRVKGKAPLDTFLAQINRSSSIERIGRRTGRYRLARA